MVKAPKFPIPLADLQKAQKEMVPKIGYKSGIGQYNPGFKEDPATSTRPRARRRYRRRC